MCGLVGYWSTRRRADSALVALMAQRIESRGPDSSGVWLDTAGEVALGHRRLSIIDLSAAGHQPMESTCGRYVVSYNGEIYNHLDLRAALETECGQINWRGHSDTETLLTALRAWGVDKTLRSVNGMFAFALWDAQERLLYLARDRLGEKPLFYGVSGDTFFFGSELKAFTPHPDWRPTIDRDSLAQFLRHNYVPAPRSIYKQIRKLSPAHFVVVTSGGKEVGEPVCYWDAREVAETGRRNQVRGDARELTDQLDARLSEAVLSRMAADVPLGAFLSGGYDSSTIVALMQTQSSRPVKTFTIGFNEADYNEAEYAKEIARHLGTDHTELFVTPADAIATVPELPRIWDEPFSDSSQIPTLLLSRLTRKHVTVSLSGDGGDELFHGYSRYTFAADTWGAVGAIPPSLRLLIAAAIRRLPFTQLEAAQSLLPNRMRISHLADRLPKIAELFSHGDGMQFYRNLISHWKTPNDIVLGAEEPPPMDLNVDLPRLTDRMMLADLLCYLPGDILTKVDRASMAVGLEARVPMLDHRVVEFAWRLPNQYKFRNQEGKWLLRQLAHRYVPKALLDRPKMGFSVPIDEWLRGPLRDWAEDLLNERGLVEEGFFDPRPIRQKWEEHLSGLRRWHYYLWDILMFQAWLRSAPH